MGLLFGRRGIILLICFLAALGGVYVGCDSGSEVAPSTPTINRPAVALAQSPAIPAFPGAEGHGALSQGGRGGRIIEVTNLNDHVPGSLRACVDASGPRICVFRVAGEIVLRESRLKIKNPYLTIAGQTAPGDGITIRAGDSKVRPLMNIEGDIHDVIIRYLKFRLGKDNKAIKDERDGITIRSGQNIILDHISVEWSTDEAIGINPTGEGKTVGNITIQRSIIAETLRPHSTGMLVASNSPNEETSQITLHHNLFAHNAHRNPRVDSAKRIQVINNVVYNWRNRVGSTVAGAEVDFTGNYFKAGPWSGIGYDIILHEHVHPDSPSEIFPDSSLYAEDNIAIPFQKDYGTWQHTVPESPDSDQWAIFRYHYQDAFSPEDLYLPEAWRRSTSTGSPSVPVTIQSPQRAYVSVLADVGDNARIDSLGKWVTKQDVIDRNIIANVTNETGPAQDSQIDHQNDFGGYPAINPGIPYPDSDHDGMADAWEILWGFNRIVGSDGPEDADGDGYTNVEEFLNGTQPGPLPGTESSLEFWWFAEDSDLERPFATGDGNIAVLENGSISTCEAEVSSEFTLPQPATYYLWVHIYGLDPSSDAINFGIDGSSDRVYSSTPDNYEWVRVETSDGSGTFGFDLDLRTHNLQCGDGTTNARFDATLFTNDPSPNAVAQSVLRDDAATPPPPSLTPTEEIVHTPAPSPSPAPTVDVSEQNQNSGAEGAGLAVWAWLFLALGVLALAAGCFWVFFLRTREVSR